jgi:hypothetical protein
MEVDRIIKTCLAMLIAAILEPIALLQIAQANLTGVDTNTQTLYKLTGVIGALAIGIGFIYMITKE